MTALAVAASASRSAACASPPRSISNVEPGERRLIIGPNGAGKTTLFNLITGELAPDGGSIQLFDRDITRVPSRAARISASRAPTRSSRCLPGDTILRNATLALLGLSPLRWNPYAALDRQQHLVDAARAALKRVGLDHIADRPLAQTSYGETPPRRDRHGAGAKS